jgi:predicted phage terminase large subunit-like protein
MLAISRQDAAIELLARRNARNSLIEYVSYMMPEFEPSWHHKDICEKLEAVESGEIKRLIITLPPRHSKSLLASEMFPGWFIGRNPNKQIITSSYGADLASDFGRKVRNMIKGEQFQALFPKVLLAEDSQATGKWHTNFGGVYVASGVGGAITGKGAHVAIIDDPIKNREDAESDTIRKKIWDWYTSTLYTRLMPDGAVIVIQTRWHSDDLVGRLLREQDHADKWTVIDYPAISKDEQALWPAWYSLEALIDIKKVIGSRDFSALYQQAPSGDSTLGFADAWLRYWTPQATGLNVYLLCDPASEKKKTSDYTVFMVVGIGADENYYVLDMVRDRLNLAQKAKYLFMLHKKYKPLAVGYEKYGMQSDIEHYEYLMERKNYRFDIQPLSGATAKNDRIRRLVPLFEAGRVYLPEYCSREDYQGNMVNLIKAFVEEEYKEFPVSAHDDMLDCLARIKDPDFETDIPNKADAFQMPDVPGYGVLDNVIGF